MTDLPSAEALRQILDVAGVHIPHGSVIRAYLHQTDEGRALLNNKQDAERWRELQQATLEAQWLDNAEQHHEQFIEVMKRIAAQEQQTK